MKKITLGLAALLILIVIKMATDTYNFEPKGQASTYPPSVDVKNTISASLDELLPDKAINVLWNNYFYYFTWIESINAIVSQGNDSAGNTQANITIPGSWEVATSGSGSLSFGTAGAVLATGATNGSATGIDKRPISQAIIRLDKPQRFRTAFRLSATTNQVAYLVRGGVAIAGATNKYFGFRINGNALQGTVENNNASTRTNLDLGVTLSANTTYEVEARLFPNDKVIFLVKNATTNIFEEKGVIATYGAAGIPTGTTQVDFFEFYIGNSAAEDKQITVSYVEYVQLR